MHNHFTNKGTRLYPWMELHNYFTEHTPKGGVIHIFVKRLNKSSTDNNSRIIIAPRSPDNIIVATRDKAAINVLNGDWIRESQWTQLGDILNIIEECVRTLCEIYRKPFTCIHGSSGMGKTQMALALGGMKLKSFGLILVLSKHAVETQKHKRMIEFPSDHVHRMNIRLCEKSS